MSPRVQLKTPNAQVEKTEIEPTTKTPENPTLPHQGGAENGALISIDPALASIIDAWPKLPEPLRAGILAMIRTASG